MMCSQSCAYFVHNYVYIYDATSAVWIPFHLWAKQAEVLSTLVNNRLVIILKARQLGQTWLVLAFCLWLMIFHPSVTALVFSRREDESRYLLERLKGMYDRIPYWMQVKKVVVSNTQMWQFSNGSTVYGFPTTAGDSYTASIAIVDEADLVPDLDRLMTAVKPTIDGGGRMILLSRSNKEEPSSPFKNMYKAARDGKSPWVSIFLPWYVRPERTEQWYAEQRADILGRTGSLDDLFEQYPATDVEALMARTLDKRIPPQWLEACFQKRDPIEIPTDAPNYNNLRIFRPPVWGRTYTIGADPAEGNPSSDDSALEVLDDATGEEMCSLADKIEPSVFSENISDIAAYYNNAGVLVERNNHGHAVLQYLEEQRPETLVLLGQDGNPGWLSTTRGKALMWSTTADYAKDHKFIVHDNDTYLQLGSIEGGTLRAPKNEHDDRAVAFGLATRAISGEDAISYAYNYVKGQNQ